MSLHLGQIPFPAGHEPYTPPEKRRRKRRAREVRPSGAPAGLTFVVVPSNASDISEAAALSIRPDTLGPRDVQFLMGVTQERMGRSIAASFGGHAVGIALLLFLISLAPERVYELIEPNRENYGIVWLPEEGPGGGGGGGGNESLELPRQVELQGVDETQLSVPVEPEPDFIEPDIEPEPLDTDRLNIPAVSMASALQTSPGVMEGVVARLALSRGSGTGGGGGTGQGTGLGPGDGPGLGPGQGGGVGGGVYRPGSGIVNPRVLREVTPDYTSEAMRARVQGEVWLEVVVLPDGTVGDVTITKSIDSVFGLDEEAIRAARQWIFAPGTRFGEPVAVLVVIALDFALR